MDTFLETMGLFAIILIILILLVFPALWANHECHTIISEEQVIPELRIKTINGVKDTTFVYTIKEKE